MSKERPVYKRFAQENRKKPTPAERHLWFDFLRMYPVNFTRQQRLLNYIVDFYCHQARLVIELDGSQHYTSDGRFYDANRTAALEDHGIMVLRYTNAQLFQYFDAICEQIGEIVQKRIHLGDER